MATSKKQPVDPDTLERMSKGTAGKLWRIEVLYYYDQYDTKCSQTSSQIKRIEIVNRTWEEVMDFRWGVYETGVMQPVDPGHWIVISPADIKRVDVYRQNGYL